MFTIKESLGSFDSRIVFDASQVDGPLKIVTMSGISITKHSSSCVKKSISDWADIVPCLAIVSAKESISGSIYSTSVGYDLTDRLAVASVSISCARSTKRSREFSPNMDFLEVLMLRMHEGK